MDNPVRKVTVRDLSKKKAAKEKIVTITAYDAIMADWRTKPLRPDSGWRFHGQHVLGYRTPSLTLDESLMLTAAVCRGAKRAMVIGDMPFISYQINCDEAVPTLAVISKEMRRGWRQTRRRAGHAAGHQAACRSRHTSIRHIGLLPQSVLQDGGYRIHGRSSNEARRSLTTPRRPGSRRHSRHPRRHSGATQCADQRTAEHTHHRHWRRPALRWPDPSHH